MLAGGDAAYCPNTGREGGGMNEQAEKLVEEIGEMLADYYTGEDASGLSFVIPFHEDRRLAERIIARIGKAYADGMPLPGEEARTKNGEEWLDWIEEIPRDSILIALTGTGKQEAK